MRPTPSRAALAAITTTAFLSAGTTSAQAAAWSPFAALTKARTNTELKISNAFSIKPTTVRTNADGSVTMKNATVLVGELTGTGVTAKATETGVVLSGGTYVAPTSLTKNTLTPSTTAPLKVGLSDTGVTSLTGDLVSTKSTATAKQLDQSLSEDLDIPAGAVPAAPTNQPWSFKLGLDLQGLSVKASAGYASLDGRIYWTTGYNFSVSLTGLPWNGGLINVTGSVSGKSIFSPNRTYGLKGSIVGAVNVAPKTQLLSGSVEWGAGGFTVAGTVRLQCTSGYLDASAKGTFTDVNNFKVTAKGLASDCTFGKVASFDEKTFDATVTRTAGVIKFDAGFSGARLDLYSRWLTPDAEVRTFLSDVGGRITNDCS
ncbi:MAG: hypothetical protein Q7T55_09825, partial [Solirubrobacteraceae bacterium]|nr:hypothetical protein [Solirubrobacteraceae bacterium]